MDNNDIQVRISMKFPEDSVHSPVTDVTIIPGTRPEEIRTRMAEVGEKIVKEMVERGLVSYKPFETHTIE